MTKMPPLHIAMFPWFAQSHMSGFLLLSNELAQRGHKVSFLIPNKAITRLESANLHSHLIKFHPIAVPHVSPLPPGTETASEIPIELCAHLSTAIDLTRPQVENLLSELKPDIVLYDFAFWIPEVAKTLGFKTICFNTVSAASLAIGLVPSCKLEEDMVVPPPGYPSAVVVFRESEAQALNFIYREFGSGLSFYDRAVLSMSQCDAISVRTCKELENDLCRYLSEEYKKPVLLPGPILPKPDKKPLEERWARWLDKFESGSVIFCAFGSQWVLEKDQFQELVLGLELTGLPFLVAAKAPTGASSVEEALPEGFMKRVGERGIVYGDWVQQLQILNHKSIGCFVSHCGYSSMWESLTSNCQLVLVPYLGDQILNTRLLADELKIAVEVERDDNRRFTKEGICDAVKSVMDEESQVGNLVRENHDRFRETLTNEEFASGYIDKFIDKLYEI